MLWALLVSGCEFPKISLSDSDRSAPNSQERRDAYGGVYFRIQADYEVIETGEPLNFDFIVSCYNREVAGSFHGILKPTTMFKATSTGAAVAISPLKRYCERAVNGQKLIRDDDLMKMPLLSWYPDVTNLAYAFVYMTNDAYTGPQAKVKFKRYDIAKSDRAAFLAWEAKALADYKQVGAIPGPFGCATANIKSSEPYACSSVENLKRNQGFQLAISNKDVWTHHISVSDLPPDVSRALKSTNNIEGDTYCDFANNKEDGKRQRSLLAQTQGLPENSHIRKQLADYFKKRQHNRMRASKDSGVYLDPISLLSDLGEPSIREVYPIVNYRHPLFKQNPTNGRLSANNEIVTLGVTAALNSQVIFQDKWRGFAIAARQRPLDYFLPDMKPTQYDGNSRGVLFLNDKLVCEKPRVSALFEFTDFTTHKYFKTR